jgi:hypothetical protein
MTEGKKNLLSFWDTLRGLVGRFNLNYTVRWIVNILMRKNLRYYITFQVSAENKLKDFGNI